MTTRPMLSTLSSELRTKIEARQAKVAVIGMGYVGLPLALLYIGQRFPVTGFDIDRKKVDTLNQGGSYIYRIEAEDVQQARRVGFAATTDFSRIAEMDAVIICVPTPLDEYHQPDLSYIVKTAESLGPFVHAG